MAEFNKYKFYDYISTFFKLVNKKTSLMLENLWHGMHVVRESMILKANRLLLSIDPQLAMTDAVDAYLDIKIDIQKSIPTSLDSTSLTSNYTINPIGVISIDPITIGTGYIYSDMIEISGRDYHSIRDVCLGSYAVLSVDGESLIYKISQTKSSKEVRPDDLVPGEPNRYLNPKNSIDNIYAIELEDANLSKMKGVDFSFYITTGKAYRVDKSITNISKLQTNINNDGNDGLVLYSDDFTLYNGVLEFNHDITHNADIIRSGYLYCMRAEVIETNIFNMYGSLVDIPEWDRYISDNTSGKSIISGLMKSLQNSSSEKDYNRALNIYYGLPIAPQDSYVVGLYESYGYEIDRIEGDSIYIKTEAKTLHPFFQKGGSVISSESYIEMKIIAIDSDEKRIDVNDTSNITSRDLLNVKLPNKFKLSKAYGAGYVQRFTCSGSTDVSGVMRMLKHVIDTLIAITPTELYEAIVYGTGDGDGINNDGIYHIKSITLGPKTSDLIFNAYADADDPTPKYNDYIKSEDNISTGHIHMPWPTHKYLLLKFNDGSYHKAFIDTSIDTIYDTGDRLKAYDVICRNVSAINIKSFKNWFEFNKFKRYNSIDAESNILELIAPIRGARFDQYFPIEYKEG